MFDYEAIKDMAKRIGRPVTDLLALSPIVDPYYADLGHRRGAAEWFAELWAEHGAAGVDLRRLHYRLISTPGIVKPDGTAYENTLGDWKTLVSASLSARYLDLIPIDDLIDRRNAEPMLFAPDVDADPDQEITAASDVLNGEPFVEALSVPDMPGLPWLALDLDAPVQRFIVEIWIEKSSENDWLVPLCQRRGVNLLVGIGDSETRSRELAVRSAEYGAPVRIIYLSDFDPAGARCRRRRRARWSSPSPSSILGQSTLS